MSENDASIQPEASRPIADGGRRIGRLLAFIGSMSLLSPAGVVPLTLILALVALHREPGSTVDPVGVSQPPRMETFLLLSAAFGSIVLWFMGLVMVLISMFVCRYFSPWFWCLLIAAALLPFVMGIPGIVAGSVAIALLIWKRSVFFNRGVAA